MEERGHVLAPLITRCTTRLLACTYKPYDPSCGNGEKTKLASKERHSKMSKQSVMQAPASVGFHKPGFLAVPILLASVSLQVLSKVLFTSVSSGSDLHDHAHCHFHPLGTSLVFLKGLGICRLSPLYSEPRDLPAIDMGGDPSPAPARPRAHGSPAPEIWKGSCSRRGSPPLDRECRVKAR